MAFFTPISFRVVYYNCKALLRLSLTAAGEDKINLIRISSLKTVNGGNAKLFSLRLLFVPLDFA